MVFGAVVEGGIINAGPTATLQDSGSFACWMPRVLKLSVSVTEQTTDWRAGCGRSACPVRRGERRKPMRRSYLYLERLRFGNLFWQTV